MEDKTMIVLIGESAGGKSTLERRLQGLGFGRVISYTTRLPREKERQDVDYHYIAREEFHVRYALGLFAEHAFYNGNYYGIAKEDVVDDAVATVEPDGLRQLKEKPELNVVSFYIKSSERERMRRMLWRGDEVNDIIRRIQLDREHFAGIEDLVDYTIYSPDLPEPGEGLDQAFGNIVRMLNELGIQPKEFTDALPA